MAQKRTYPGWAGIRAAVLDNPVLDSIVLAVACLATYLVLTRVLSQLYFISKSDAMLGVRGGRHVI